MRPAWILLDHERERGERFSWKMSNFLGKIVKDVGSLSDSSNCQRHDDVSTVDADVRGSLLAKNTREEAS